MSNRLDGVRGKSERAKKHIGDLDARIGAFCGGHPYVLGAKPHRVPEIFHTTLYIASVSAIPPDIPLLIGDAIHNLRSSLDHLIWQLVERGDGMPNKDTYFPICIDPGGAHKFASAVGKGEIERIPVGAEKVLLAVQPYISKNDTLWNIHELDRIDKHRLLIAAVSSYDQWGVTVGGRDKIFFNESAPIPLQVGYEIVNIPTGTYTGESHDNFKLKTDISFGEAEIIAGQSVLESLNEMAVFVDDIIARFEPFLG